MGDFVFKVLASSSSGNCAFLRANGLNMLIDAGISASKIRKSIAEFGVDLPDINAVFITHEHSDHCCALKSLAKFPSISVFASQINYEIISYKTPEVKNLSWKLFKGGQSFAYESLKVKTFELPHDASDTVAYLIDTGQKRVLWMTDLGKPTLLAKQAAKLANILVLESNYCPKLLERSRRPLQLKRRISGTHGHLSNADAISILRELDPNVLERVFLAHISKECNDVNHIAELISVLPPSILSKVEIFNPFS
ncbi:MAG: MBL fold metallo-hydrolase [Opitutales bacterium]|nr:MBL fold metallo-hydrolase [Opitutales bacterium]